MTQNVRIALPPVHIGTESKYNWENSFVFSEDWRTPLWDKRLQHRRYRSEGYAEIKAGRVVNKEERNAKILARYQEIKESLSSTRKNSSILYQAATILSKEFGMSQYGMKYILNNNKR